MPEFSPFPVDTSANCFHNCKTDILAQIKQSWTTTDTQSPSLMLLWRHILSLWKQRENELAHKSFTLICPLADFPGEGGRAAEESSKINHGIKPPNTEEKQLFIISQKHKLIYKC